MPGVNDYIVNGELTENCTISQELVSKCTFSISQQIPIRQNEEEVANDKRDARPRKQYWQRFLEVQYPGGGKTTGVILPGVVFHHELGDYFEKTAVCVGVPQWIVRLLEVQISAAGGSCGFTDRRLASDEKYWWTRCTFNDAAEGKEYIRTVDEEGEEYFGSFHDLFSEYPTSIVANVTCSLKMTCEVEKGEEPKKGDFWRAGLRVSMVTPVDAIDIPPPQSGTINRSIAGKKDTMKADLKKVKRSE
ncbi:hypothetical protein KC338_g8834 [Hortaea werneckii]|nr:hypothetical protein KC323_g8910 [Hortaea werneckii]KAI6855548.1 hypothetical protein KC338_g8834 [Hortaea werneckii]KAI7069915.1 hypothetical protein KC339_g14701 [Hortaea werneckii]KAI7224183.1 hypothetical protein KC365_g10899 [Hortaea werneckii]